ncbi:peptidoglycan recognition protein [Conexibacter stalactiti]|uniref:Peptidoglycan recognition protein n=1 Tax=Conexibacter stalactiti TaxID=1940611 RepID=A0ABU4HI00_9ACTN|nr:peptidoglycan recognition protein [Conexibacter stalactiti]MDW5592933.1 peptidoglycan recognition protein [Conexibacter stalactiti]MEC5033574.1 peptidoglycan recognition protein [Conexibacter stalactiti]
MRRTVVPVILAALAAAASTAPAAAAPAAVADFEQRAPALTDPARPAAASARAAEQRSSDSAAHASAAAALRTTAPIRAPRPFQLLGLRWRGDEEAHVEVRVQRASGRWSRWGEVPHAEDEPAADRRDETVSGPLWTGSAIRYQLRARTLPRALHVHFVAVPRGAVRAASGAGARTDDARPAQAAPGGDGGSGSGGERPAIVPRSQWDPGDACRPRSAPRYGRVDFSVVHHTESLTAYSRDEAAAMVLGICRFHRNGNGWLDIGYNLLVDRFGTVYEGRAGGVEQPVIGAHAGGWNSIATGVAVIGSFTSRRPPAAAREALSRVLAWKLSLGGVPATGTIAKVSAGGEENRWPTGSTVRLSRIVGHRDVDETDCPGGAFYGLLPALRAQTAPRVDVPADQLTSSPIGGVLPQGGPVALTGRLTLAGGRRPVGARLTLQRRDGEEWSELGTLRTGSDGIWSASVPVTVNGSFRVVADGVGVTAPAVGAEVAAGVGARVTPQLLQPGREVTVSGTTTPAKERVTVLVERQARAGGPWRQLRRVALDTVDGAYETTIPLPSSGLHRVVVTTAADALNAAGSSPVRTARVRAPGRGRR